MVRTLDILNARILIVDDQESHVLLLERMLRDAGYTSVESTTDPTEVCKLHRQNRYAAIPCCPEIHRRGSSCYPVIEIEDAAEARATGDLAVCRVVIRRTDVPD